MIISGMLCNFLSFTPLFYICLQLLSAQKCFKQSIMLRVLIPLKREESFLVWQRTFPASEAFPPCFFLCDTTKLSLRNRKSGVPIPSLSCSWVWVAWTLCLLLGIYSRIATGLLLLHQICPNSVMSHIIWRLGNRMSVFQCQRHHLRLLCDSSIFILLFCLKSVRLCVIKEQIWSLKKELVAGKFRTNLHMGLPTEIVFHLSLHVIELI